MPKSNNSSLKTALRLHKALIWISAVALGLFLLSALAHPLMIWTGPRAATFFPPKFEVNGPLFASLPNVVQKIKISHSTAVKVVPSESGPLLQITEGHNTSKRYFDPKSGEELAGQDEKQAIWLARYYSGLPDTPIKQIELQTQFDDSYPWVNRLLPIYKVHFETSDNLVLFVDTDTLAMGGISNDWKRFLQFVFQKLHTWNWLGGMEDIRLLLMTASLLIVSIMLISGLIMLIRMKSRKILDRKRRWHRGIAYGISLPLLALLLSGAYHLYASSINGRITEVPLSPALSSDVIEQLTDVGNLSLPEKQKFNAISLIQGPDSQLYYRFAAAPHHPHGHMSHDNVFDGLPSEKTAFFYHADTFKAADFGDREIVVSYARRYLNKEESIDARSKMITRFGPEYDFRNKRLPIWQVSFADQPRLKLYIDPVTGKLVEQMSSPIIFERYLFSWLHKWDFLVPPVGRMGRDGLVFLFLGMTMSLLILGITLKISTRKKRPKT